MLNSILSKINASSDKIIQQNWTFNQVHSFKINAFQKLIDYPDLRISSFLKFLIRSDSFLFLASKKTICFEKN